MLDENYKPVHKSPSPSQRARQLLGKNKNDNLNKSERRELAAKAKKIKTSEKKAERHYRHALIKQELNGNTD